MIPTQYYRFTPHPKVSKAGDKIESIGHEATIPKPKPIHIFESQVPRFRPKPEDQTVQPLYTIHRELITNDIRRGQSQRPAYKYLAFLAFYKIYLLDSWWVNEQKELPLHHYNKPLPAAALSSSHVKLLSTQLNNQNTITLHSIILIKILSHAFTELYMNNSNRYMKLDIWWV